MPHTLHDVRSLEDMAIQATRAAKSQLLERHLYNPEHNADFVSRLRGFVDATPHVIRHHRATQCFLETADRLCDKKNATPQSLRYNLLEIFTEQPQLSHILELDPGFNPAGFWACETTDQKVGIISRYDSDMSFVQLCVMEEISETGRTELLNLPLNRVQLVPAYLPLDF